MSERDYVLGTHDEEVERLGLQHRVWRPRALDAWRRAGFTVGQTVLDVGCGPGYASLDLAEIAGPSGRIIALDRSRRFLDALEARAKWRALERIETVELDLDEAELPPVRADGAWARWVFAFLKDPRALVAKIHDALRPGGVLVTHEYFDYSTWRLAPRLPEFEEFVAAVMESWRSNGGEPDVGLDLLRWLEELGFTVREVRPIVDVVTPANFVWQWPKTFFETGLERLVQLGHFDAGQSSRVRELFTNAEAMPHVRMVTPAVLESSPRASDIPSGQCLLTGVSQIPVTKESTGPLPKTTTGHGIGTPVEGPIGPVVGYRYGWIYACATLHTSITKSLSTSGSGCRQTTWSDALSIFALIRASSSSRHSSRAA